MRADKFFAEKFGSRSKAAEALKRGLVLKNHQPISPSDEVSSADEIVFLSDKIQFVSNGGFKLQKGLDEFAQSVEGEIVVDLGASTGGFCDCLLQRGVKTVYCVDVGENQLDPSLSCDPRVVVMDKTNARYLKREDFALSPTIVTSDLSFISLKLVLPVIYDLLPDDGRAFLLFKPQFECEGVGLGKSGILPLTRHAALLNQFYDYAIKVGLNPQNITSAPIKEKKNVEYVLYLRKNGQKWEKNYFLQKASECVQLHK